MEEQPTLPVAEPEETASDLDRVRELILSSHTNIVPELVQGSSVADLVASIERAREAYTRIVEAQPQSQSVTIPAGGNSPITIDINELPTSEKIRRGLAAQRA